MNTFLLVSASIVAVFVVYTLGAPLMLNEGRFARIFRVRCPVRGSEADTQVGSWVAGVSSAYGPPLLLLRHCSLLKEGEGCAESCLKTLKV